jgi:hypothetical protein
MSFKSVLPSQLLCTYIADGENVAQLSQRLQEGKYLNGLAFTHAIKLKRYDVLAWLCETVIKHDVPVDPNNKSNLIYDPTVFKSVRDILSANGIMETYQSHCAQEGELEALQVLFHYRKQLHWDCFHLAMHYKWYSCARYCLLVSPKNQKIDMTFTMNQFDPFLFGMHTQHLMTEAKWWCEFFRKKPNTPIHIQHFINLCDRYNMSNHALEPILRDELITLGISQCKFLKTCVSLYPLPVWKD